MQVIGIPLFIAFMDDHPEDECSMIAWLQMLRASEFHNIKQVCRAFPTVETEGGLTAFEMGSSVVVTVIHFRRQRVYIRYLLTEQAYLGGVWSA